MKSGDARVALIGFPSVGKVSFKCYLESCPWCFKVCCVP